MGVHAKIYKLDGGRVKVTVKQVMQKTGCKESAARYRLANSKKSAVVLAPKGQHKDYGYGRRKILANNTEKKPSDPSVRVLEKKRKIAHIKNTHPFYSKGEDGFLHRLVFGKW